MFQKLENLLAKLEDLSEVHITLLPTGVMALCPPASEAAQQVKNVNAVHCPVCRSCDEWLKIATARGDLQLLERSVLRYFAALMVTIALFLQLFGIHLAASTIFRFAIA